MRFLVRSACLVLISGLCFCLPALPQGKIRLEPSNLGEAEEDYRSAQLDWLNADPNLAADLFKGNPQEMHKRIQRTADLRDQMMEKKSVYLDLIVKHFNETRARLAIPDAQIPIPELRRDLEDEQSRLLGEQERLDALIHDLPQDDLYTLVAHELNVERTQLVNLQNSVALRIRGLDAIGKNQDAVRNMEANDPIAKNLEAISKIWESERDNTKIQREHWKALYAAMNRAVDGGKTPAPTPPPAGNTKPADTPAAKPRGALLPSRDSGRSLAFEGTWKYEKSPNAWSGFGEPVQVALELHRSGSTISGTYNARIPGRRDMRDLNLTLQGDELAPGKAVFRWVSLVPAAHGELTVQMGGDRRVLLERTKSSDTYFPLGMEVLLPLQAP